MATTKWKKGNNTYDIWDARIPAVQAEGGQQGYVLTVNSDNQLVWSPTQGSGASSLKELTDVNISDLIENGQVLVYNTDERKWVNKCLTVKSDTTEHWDEHKAMVPLKGEVIVYEDYSEYCPGIKIGDGKTSLNELPFLDSNLQEHINNIEVHLRDGERTDWNNKVTIDNVENETLKFSKTI